jgi:hypothetical protein
MKERVFEKIINSFEERSEETFQKLLRSGMKPKEALEEINKLLKQENKGVAYHELVRKPKSKEVYKVNFSH